MARDKGTTVTGRRWRFGWCEFDEISRVLTVNGQPTKVDSRPLDVLAYLLTSPSGTVSKQELIETLWGQSGDENLHVAIAKLRKAFGGKRDEIILNIAGVGYRMAVPVACVFGKQPVSSPIELAIGQEIPGRPDWKVIQRLGRDETSPVWLAMKESASENLVFKFAMDGIRLGALQREATVSRIIERSFQAPPPWFVRVKIRGFDDAPYYIGSEYGGVDLLEWSGTKEFVGLTLAARIRLATEIIDAVASAHTLGILHNDLKPSNILIHHGDKEPGSIGSGDWKWQVKVADFGVASIYDSQRLRELDITDYGVADPTGPRSTPVGTAMYRAPEVRAGTASTAIADVYSLGVLLYQITIGDFTQQLSPGWQARIPDPILQDDIAAAAEIDPSRRLKSAAELASLLHRIEERRVERQMLESERSRARQAERLLERARLRRPWIILAATALVTGFCVSLILYRQALNQKNLADARSLTLEAMYQFLGRDLLGQANPALNVPGGNVPGQTLLNAIRTVIPRIDERFAHQPEISARLHLTAADAFRTRAQYPEADQQYLAAARRFRDAEGELSQDAVMAELKREDTLLVGLTPGAIEQAKAGFASQQTILKKIRTPNAELQGWAALVGASLAGMGPKPADALPSIQDAIRRGESTPGLDPFLLMTLKKRVCGIYLRMGNGAAAEKTARALIADVSRTVGRDAPSIAPLEMFVQEGLYLQGRYQEAVAQSDWNYAHFIQILGPQHQLTLSTLANRAASEGQLGRYDDAAHDDLKLYAAESSAPSPSPRIRFGSLADAAMYECHAEKFEQGREHARQVISETSSEPRAMPVYATGARYTLAECAIAELEGSKKPPSSDRLNQAEGLLSNVDLKIDDPLGELADYGARVNLARARIALMRHDRTTASQFVALADPTFSGKDADPYEKAKLQRAKQEISSVK